MSDRMLHPWLQRLLALALMGIVLGAGVAAAVMPINEALAERDAANQRLTRFRTMAATPPPAHRQAALQDLVAIRHDDAEAQVALQSTVNRLAKAGNVPIQSVRPLGGEALGDAARTVWVEASFMGDLQSLADFLKALDAERPVLLVRRLDIEHGEGPRPDSGLRIKLEVGLGWRGAAP